MFHNVRLRTHMFNMLSSMNRRFAVDTSPIMGDDLEAYKKTPLDMEALFALSDSGYIKLGYYDDDLSYISRVKGGSLYTIGRTELWLNRVVSFVLGAATSLVIGVLVNFITKFL